MGVGDNVELNALASLFHSDAPGITNTRGLSLAQHTGVGAWQLNLTNPCPFGEYYCALSNLTAASVVSMSVFDGNATTKFLQVQVNGVNADVNGFSVVFYRVPPS